MPTVPHCPAPVKDRSRGPRALAPTRSRPSRTIDYIPHPAAAGCPCSGTLTLTRGAKAVAFALADVRPDPRFGDGRGFSLVKGDGTVYHCFLGVDHLSCDCPASTFEATARADRRHGDTFGSLGCSHLDALDALADLLGRGLLPHPSEPGTDAGGPTEVDELVPF